MFKKTRICLPKHKTYFTILLLIISISILFTTCKGKIERLGPFLPSCLNAKLTASDAAAVGYFGESVSISGNKAIVGAYGDDDGGTNSGSVYLFKFNGTSWIETQKLTSPVPRENARFGSSVSISGDRAIVGANRDDYWTNDAGSAFIYKYNGIAWVQEQVLSATNSASDDEFGESVSISGDKAIVGAWKDDGTGSAYIYIYSGSSWDKYKITASDAASNDRFGGSVSISGDKAIVGAFLNDDDETNAGSAYIYKYNGSSWVQEQKLTSPVPEENGWFGVSVSISGDIAIVGVATTIVGTDSPGSVYLFKFNGTSWIETQKLTASDAAAEDSFGISVSILGDKAIIGAYRDDDGGENSGSAHIFKFNGTSWIEAQKLTASDAAAEDSFGINVSISGDRAIIGAFRDDDGGEDSGSAHIYCF